ncbi:hypothetical protein ScPMuIL_010961 [Solemya velum]
MANGEFKYDPANFDYTPAMKRAYEENGYFFVRGLLPKEELEKVKLALEGTDAFTKHAYGIPDGEGSASRLVLYSHPGNDVTGMLNRCEKVAGMSEKILGGEAYHYHTKIMMKDAFTGGKHIWHQDYGYWYHNGCLFPDMLTVYIAIDACTRDNGCLQVLRGSHKCGRVEHMLIAGQQGANIKRVDEIAKVCPLVHAELQPGDAIYIHCNLLHMAPQNKGPDRRWTFLSCFNKATNDPVYKHHCPGYTAMHKVPDTAIMECQNYTDMTGKEFMKPSEDKTVRLSATNNQRQLHTDKWAVKEKPAYPTLSLKDSIKTIETWPAANRMADVEFKYDPTNFDYTPAMRRSFEENGFFYVRGLLPTDEIQKLQKAVTLNDFYKHSYGANDGDGKVSRLALFSYPGSDVTGTIARAEKVAGMAEKILGGEVYHYHSKIIMKDAFTGGQHIWHQDYGYWYNYGNLYPDLVTVYIAIDECKKDNGCLQVLRGSHKCGRIEHRRAAKQIDGVHYSGQHGADVERVQEIAKVCPLDYVELKPGPGHSHHGVHQLHGHDGEALL